MTTSLKKYFLLTLFIGFITVLITHVYFHVGFPYTHDGENHLARFANYGIAVREGQFPPRFAPNLMNHYGYPVFDFNYPLANILSLPFSALKINYEVTFKVIVWSAVSLGCLGSLLWLAKLGLKTSTQLLCVLVFGANLYLVNAITFRGSIGEVLVICLLPWLFWMIEVTLRSQRKIFSSVISILLLSAFLLSHNIGAVFSLPILLSYAVVRAAQSERKIWLKLLIVFASAIGLTLWFWLPALMEKSVTVIDQVGVNTLFFEHFPTLLQLLFSPLQFGFSYTGPVDSLSFSLGLLQILCFILGGIEVFYLVWSQRQKLLKHPFNLVYLWSFLLLASLLVFQLSITKPLWQIFFPVAKYLQFPWRLSMFWGVIILPLFGFTWEKTSRLGRILLIIFLIGQLIVISRVKAVDYFHRQIVDYNFFSQSTSTLNENRTKAFTFTDIGLWQPAPQVLAGKAKVSVQFWQGSQRAYDLDIQEDALVVEPTMLFLGWQTTANGKLIKYIDSNQVDGRLAYQLPTGKYHIQSAFTQQTWSRMLGNSVTLITALAILSWLTISIYKTKHAQN